ncbi:MAG TPA: methyltransferase domain-containing protein [Vicinamibacterales bacterium]|nr:methyltransferase domain-containing protein [Vicinamibacterales bacterium]
MPIFRRSAPKESLAVSMAAVKLGDRVLFVGAADPALVAALASKTGLTGAASLVEPDQQRLDRAREAVERAGALIDTACAPLTLLPYEAASFDIAILRDVLATLQPETRVRALQQVHRVLRPGGRVMAIETAMRAGLGALISRRTLDEHYVRHGGARRALEAEHFAGVRVIAEREGLVFVEGARPNRTS